METLLDVMYKADAVDIDGVFIRYFYMEHEDCEDVVCHIETNIDYTNYEYFFTVGQFTTAVRGERNAWEVTDDRGEVFEITPYKLTEMTA